jgi:hypothetical protein
MRCNSFKTEHQLMFPAEICVHCPGRENLAKSPIYVFPTLRVCSDCGVTQFVIPHVELRELVAEYHTVTQHHCNR